MNDNESFLRKIHLASVLKRQKHWFPGRILIDKRVTFNVGNLVMLACGTVKLWLGLIMYHYIHSLLPIHKNRHFGKIQLLSWKFLRRCLRENVLRKHIPSHGRIRFKIDNWFPKEKLNEKFKNFNYDNNK